MYQSQLVAKTSKEDPAKVESLNAKLLIKGGFISQLMAGVYSYLPLGTRVLQKIETIVREEMNTIGAEVFLPALSTKEQWQQTGRLETVDVLFKAEAANAISKQESDASYILNPTHEETITPLVQQYVQSYKDLPCAVWQIQTKFRNEARAKSGLMRGREFRMKDLYSFHQSEEDMLDYFNNKAEPTYKKVFDRLGIGSSTVVALASGGSFSKQPSKEFQTKCKNGEDQIFHVPNTDIYFNKELAPSKAKPWSNINEAQKQREDVRGESIIGVAELAKYLNIEVERTTKTLLYETNTNQIVAVVVRGDYAVNELKVCQVLECNSIHLASEETVRSVTGAEVGYAGPINLPNEVIVVWDDSTKDRVNFECGANETHMHSINVNFGTDVPMPENFYDVKEVKPGDLHPETKLEYEVFNASEVGNIFTLYTKFSDAFNFTVKDQNEADQIVYMGCYGIGTSRLMGVIAETCNDEVGLVWPEAVAPFTVHLIPIAKSTDEESYKEAEALYNQLQHLGIDCLLDDRLHQSVGARLSDADLMGIPHRIVLSKRTLEKNEVEYKKRSEDSVELIRLDKIVDFLQSHS